MRRRMRVAAISCASFVALLGFEMARMQSGNDPALARSKAVSAKRATSGTSKGSTGTQAGSDGSSGTGSDSSQQGYDDGSGYGGGYDDQSGQSYDDQSGQSYGGSQGYYQPPQSDPPTTGSS